LFTGIVGELKEYILERIPRADELWAETVSLASFSTILRGIQCVTKMGEANLNLFTMAIGPSQIAVKTLPVKEVVIPIMHKLGEMSGYDFLLPDTFSVEGLIQQHFSQYTTGLLVSDEFTWLIKMAQGSGYLETAYEFLSRIYDGQELKRTTNKFGVMKVSGTYVSLISATTPEVYKVIKPSFFKQGLGNRFLYCVIENIKSPNHTDDDLNPLINKQMRLNEINGFAQKFYDVWKNTSMQTWNVAYEPGASKKLSEWWNRCDNEAINQYKKDENSMKYSYLANEGVNTIKLAVISAVSNSHSLISSSLNRRVVLVRESDVDTAIESMKVYEQNFDKFIDQWNLSKGDVKRDVDYSDYKEKVRSAIKKNGGKATKRELLRSTNWLVKDLDQVLESMEDELRVEQKINSQGKVIIYYSLK